MEVWSQEHIAQAMEVSKGVVNQCEAGSDGGVIEALRHLRPLRAGLCLTDEQRAKLKDLGGTLEARKALILG